jgi:hypothetical protein
MDTPTGKAIGAFLKPRSALLLALLAVSAGTITLAEVQQGFLLSVNGSQFVSSSVVDSRRVVRFLECYSGDILVRAAAS